MIETGYANKPVITVIERALDLYLKDEYLEPCVYHIIRFEGVVRNLEDSVFGYIVGELTRKYHLTYFSLFEREPDSQEVSELNDLLVAYSDKLMRRIRAFIENK